MTRILLLGGTTEASLMALALARAGLDAVFSYAGRTDSPALQPLPTRVGGFGGVPGLVDWLRDHRISHVIDATHPFAAQMSRNAIMACAQTGVALLGLERAAWQPGPGDDWHAVPDLAAAVDALPKAPARVFLAIGKQTLTPFAAKPQHHYLLRLVDPPTGPLPLDHATIVIARGPFDVAADSALLHDHAITHIVAKNAGGTGAEAKLTAARAQRVPVILIDRPALPARKVVATINDVMAWLGHADTERGV